MPNPTLRVAGQQGLAFTIADQHGILLGTAVIGDGPDGVPCLSQARLNAELFAAAPDLLAELMLSCRRAMTAGTRMMEFDTWAMSVGGAEAAAMERSLRLIARLRGKSTFGNDWQDALHG